jgi:two-component system nitrate/nitrite response regulator NarL
MTRAAVGSLTGGSLRVVIAARGEARIEALARLLRSFGHEVVAGAEDPDVMLADQHRPAESLHPTVVLGGMDVDAAGVLPEDAAGAEIDAALRAVALGLIVRSAAGRSRVFSAVQEAEARALLTPREAQILDAIADGLTNKAIALRLGISLHTVKFHVEAVFRKLGASTRTQAVAKAAERRRAETIDL